MFSVGTRTAPGYWLMPHLDKGMKLLVDFYPGRDTTQAQIIMSGISHLMAPVSH
jgi:hypothetical protein